MTSSTLPLGIRNNNPGNLRSGYGMQKRVPIVNGYAKFDYMIDGVESLARLCFDYYHKLGLTTLKAFILRYAPPSENDSLGYINAMAEWLRINRVAAGIHDLALWNESNMVDFIRAIIREENGYEYTNSRIPTDWVAVSTIIEAMKRTGDWA